MLKTCVEAAVAIFQKERWVYQGRLALEDWRGAVEGLGEDGFGTDPLLHDVLVFPPGTELHNHWLTMSGQILLQDRVGNTLLFYVLFIHLVIFIE